MVGTKPDVSPDTVVIVGTTRSVDFQQRRDFTGIYTPRFSFWEADLPFAVSTRLLLSMRLSFEMQSSALS